MTEYQMALHELKTKLDAKIDKFLETQGMSGKNACLLELKAMLDAKIDGLRPNG
jgi:hypothetical protein